MVGETMIENVIPSGYTQNTEKVGKAMAKEAKNRQDEPRYKEALDLIEKKINKEQLTLGNNSALTTTTVAAFVEKELRPKLLGAGVIKTLNMTLPGHTGIQVPKGVNLSASDISDSSVTADDQDYGSMTISPGWKGLRTTLTHEILQQANIDVIADKFEEMGFAISKKVDSDLLSEIESASHKNNSTYDSSGTNDNYVFTGAATDISWSTFANAIKKAHANDSHPDTIIVNPTNEKVILTDTDFKDFIKYNQTTAGTYATPPNVVYGMNFLVSSQVPDNRTFFVDSSRCGYFVDATGVQTWDGRIDNTIKQEILAAKCYGVGVARPKSITSIADNTDDPGTGTY